MEYVYELTNSGANGPKTVTMREYHETYNGPKGEVGPGETAAEKWVVVTVNAEKYFDWLVDHTEEMMDAFDANRIDAQGKLISQGATIEMPVLITMTGNAKDFYPIDGRHRSAALKGHGAKQFGVMVPASQKALAESIWA